MTQKHLSKRSRDRLLAIASWLDSLGDRIRAYVSARTPRRGPRRAKPISAVVPGYDANGSEAP